MDAFTITMQIGEFLISLAAIFMSIVSMRQAKDSKNADTINQLEDELAEHEKEDAAAFASIRERLHTHRSILRSLEHTSERLSILEQIAKVAPRIFTDTSTRDDDWENRK